MFRAIQAANNDLCANGEDVNRRRNSRLEFEDRAMANSVGAQRRCLHPEPVNEEKVMAPENGCCCGIQ